MILAAGLGERLLPLTRWLPKPAIPVLGRPIISQIVRRLIRDGVRSVTVNLFYLPAVLTDAIGDGHELGLEELHYSFESSLLGTGGGVRKAAPFLRGEGPILVRNGDFLDDIVLARVLESHRASGLSATLVLAPPQPGFTPVPVSAGAKILGFGSPSGAADVWRTGVFTGLQLVQEELLDRLPEGRPSDIVKDLYVDLAARGELNAFFHEGFWWEFGSLEGYLRGSLHLLGLPADRRAQIAETDPVRELGSARVAVGPGADFHHGVELRGRVALGFASMIAEGGFIEDSVVMPEAWIGPGCRLSRVVVASGVEVPAGLELEDGLVCADPGPSYSLPPLTYRWKGLLIRSFSTAMP